MKTSTKEGGDVYLASIATHADNDVWLIDSGASFHMTPRRKWFFEYEKYNRDDVFLEMTQQPNSYEMEELSCCSKTEGL
jgi:hypothetical protein